MAGSGHTISLHLVYAQILNLRGELEKVERDRAVAPPVAPKSRLLRTVRGPGTPTVDAALESVAARGLARCRQLPKCLWTAMSPYGVVPVGATSAAEDAATDVAQHDGVGACDRSDVAKQ